MKKILVAIMLFSGIFFVSSCEKEVSKEENTNVIVEKEEVKVNDLKDEKMEDFFTYENKAFGFKLPLPKVFEEIFAEKEERDDVTNYKIMYKTTDSAWAEKNVEIFHFSVTSKENWKKFQEEPPFDSSSFITEKNGEVLYYGNPQDTPDDIYKFFDPIKDLGYIYSFPCNGGDICTSVNMKEYIKEKIVIE